MAPQSRRISKPAGEVRRNLSPNVGAIIPQRQTASSTSARKSHGLDALTGRARLGAPLLIFGFLGLLTGL